MLLWPFRTLRWKARRRKRRNPKRRRRRRRRKQRKRRRNPRAIARPIAQRSPRWLSTSYFLHLHTFTSTHSILTFLLGACSRTFLGLLAHCLRFLHNNGCKVSLVIVYVPFLMFFLCPWFSFACQSCPRGDYLQDSDDWVEAPPTTGSVDKAWKVTGQAQTASSSTNSAQVSKSCVCTSMCVCVKECWLRVLELSLAFVV